MRKAIVGLMTLVSGIASASEPCLNAATTGVETATTVATKCCDLTSAATVAATPTTTPATPAPAKAAAPALIETPATPYEPFTGKICRNKVRLRLQPNVESDIVRELTRHEMLLIVGEQNGFYAVQAPANIKAYVFRTFILDSAVEGRRVNVRLKPDTESPVIAQLNAGDKVKGAVCASNGKWMEIEPPSAVKFYVAKEFVERAGDAEYITKVEKQREEAIRQLSTLSLMSQSELRKPFDEANVDGIVASLDKLIGNYGECAMEVERAKALRSLIKEAYTQKRISHLEAKAHTQDRSLSQKNAELATQIETYQAKLVELEQKLNGQSTVAADESAKTGTEIPAEGKIVMNVTPRLHLVTDKMSIWEPVEQAYFDQWMGGQSNGASWHEFYAEQSEHAVPLKGIVEAYNKPIKNKPGDYMLVDQQNKLPIAFLYSTKLNLQELIGQQVTVIGVPRPNNNFAYPAFYALSAD
jgi:uncharacterized protein YgiM (DUF1202 family)